MISQVTIGETRHNFNPRPLIIEAGDYEIGKSKFKIEFFDNDGAPMERLVIKKLETFDLDNEFDRINFQSIETAKMYLPNCSVLQIDASRASDEELLEIEDLILELKTEVKSYNEDKIRELALLLKIPSETTISGTRLLISKMIADDPKRVKSVILFDDKKERLLVQKAIEEGYIIEDNGNFKYKGTQMTRIIANSFEAVVATIRDKDNKELYDEIKARVSGFNQGAPRKDNNIIFDGNLDATDLYKGVAAKITKAIKNDVIKFEDENYVYMNVVLGKSKDDVQDILCKPENKALYESFLEDLANEK